MSHDINYNEQTGKHSFFSVKEKAWHGLGQIVKDYQTSAEALKFAGLDYYVEKRKLYTQRNEYENPQISVPDYYATLRSDTNQVLGVVGKDYEVIQNVNAFNFFDAIVGGEGIQYETAGALGKGERIFITAKLPTYTKVGRDDLIEQYLFLTTSHDGYGSITAVFTPIRIVCNNTLNAALKYHNNAIKIRHTANAKERLEQAHKVMGIPNQLSQQMEEVFNSWAKVRVTDPELKSLIQLAMLPNKEVLENIQAGKWDELSTCFNNMCMSVNDYSFNRPTQKTETTKGTLFGAYNAVTGYFQNVRNYKNEESKLKSLLYGGTAQMRTQKAYNLCRSFTKGELAGIVN